jgi:hypothetical protein
MNQIQISNETALDIGNWSLKIIWYLGFGIWDLTPFPTDSGVNKIRGKSKG